MSNIKQESLYYDMFASDKDSIVPLRYWREYRHGIFYMADRKRYYNFGVLYQSEAR
jgi:hypothetical protein